MSKLIAIDIDDVLSQSVEQFVRFSNEHFGTTLTPEDFTEDLAKVWHVDHAEIARRLKIYFASDVIKQCRPMPGAALALEKLARTYKLAGVTSRTEQQMPATREWLKKHYPSIALEVHPAGLWDKLEKNAHKKTKAALCVQLGAGYLIDDQPKHCLAAAECGISVVLFGDYPWNRQAQRADKVARCKDWSTVLRWFDGRN